ncbi:MAG TPA: winged helix DNA-binding domain-containing protein [Candidatus Dormibacteraeota bacterium]|nr:winged helix DNA-binding domain-containing protein [Candidatus Dormibacteraeota bacterium]
MPAPPPVLTQRQLNRALLARQMLLERARTSVPKGLDRMGALQAQYAPAMYIGLWSRLEGIRREDVDAALEQRTAVQGTLLRGTIHLVSTADYWPLALATRKALRDWYSRVAWHDDPPQAVDEAAARVREMLRQRSPQSRKELQGSMTNVMWNGVGFWLNLLRVPPSGTWARRRADIYAAAEDWIGPAPDGLDFDTALDHTVTRYLTGFGPASAAEIANWAGLKTASAVAPALERLRLVRFRAENGDELVDLPRAPRPDPETPAPVRFLPVWDATLLAHARRALVLREDDRPRVFNIKTPHSVNTFLVDGQVAGTWRYEKGQVAPSPFRTLDHRTMRQVEAEGARLAEFHA